MTGAPAYFKFARAVEKLIASDDGKGAVMPRRALEDLLSTAPRASDCTDPDLFAAFLALLVRWSRRIDPVERGRLEGPIVSMCDVLMRLPGEARRLAIEEASRRRDPKLMAAEATGA